MSTDTKKVTKISTRPLAVSTPPRHPHYAYPQQYANIETVMRFGSVKRWHMLDTDRQQTLAEHSANVALLAYGIAKECPGMYFGPAESVVIHALVHDLEEVFTGDIPTNTKKRLQGLDQMEMELLPKTYKIDTPFVLVRLVKLCDLADAVRFINNHGKDYMARHARDDLGQVMRDKLREAEEFWPAEVVEHVKEWVTFYAFAYS